MMILVVVVLVLLFVVATAYLQRARLDRASVSVNTSNQIDQVAEAAIEQIKGILKADLVDEASGNFLDPANGIEGYDYPWTNPAVTFSVSLRGGGTGNARGGQLDDTWLASICPEPIGGVLAWRHITNLNGIFLDLPREDPSETLIPRIPRETVVAGDPNLNPAVNPLCYNTLTSSAAFENSDTNLQIVGTNITTPALDTPPPPVSGSYQYQLRGYDVDGDGVVDSRWTWAPVRQVNGVDYVMAVRIIDNSAMININAATTVTSDGGNGFGANADRPVGYWPTTLNLSRLFFKSEFGGGLTDGIDAALATVKGRCYPSNDLTTVLTAPTSVGLDLATADEVTYQPRTQAALYWTSLLRYGEGYAKDYWWGPKDEIALRFGNGIRSVRFGRSPVEQALYDYKSNDSSMKSLTGITIKNSANQETGGEDHEGESFMALMDLKDTDYTFPKIQNEMRDFFEGNGAAAGVPLSQTSRTFNDVRKWLTTYSGAMEILPRNYVSVGTPPNLVTKVSLLPHEPADFAPAVVVPDPKANVLYTKNLNYQWSGTANSHLPEVDPILTSQPQLRRPIREALDFGTGTNKYLGIASFDADPASGWFAACIKDYGDEDSEPTVWGTGPYYYGLERLPFFRQVYIQEANRAYDVYDATGTQTATGDDVPDKWGIEPGTRAIAIELGNPFYETLRATQLPVRILITDGNAAHDWIKEFNVDINQDIDGRGILIIYCDAGSGGGFADLSSSLGFGAGPGVAIEKLPNNNGLEDFDVITVLKFELQVQISGVGWVTYDRIEGSNLQFGSEDDYTIALGPYLGPLPGGISEDDIRWYQASYGRHCSDGTTRGVQYLSTEGEGEIESNELDSTFVNTFNLGGDNKFSTGTGRQVELDNFQLIVANRPMLNPAELGWIHMFGFTNDTSTGHFPEFMRQMIATFGAASVTGSTTQIPRRSFLDFANNAVIAAGAGEPAIPHAAMMLDRFSTLSPEHDGIDNDDDDFDSDETTNADGDGTTNGPRELFVPGRINVNTAPAFLLALAAPGPELLNSLEWLMNSVARYRDVPVDRITGLTPFTAAAGLRAEPGILSLGELMWLRSDSGYVVDSMQLFASNNWNLDETASGWPYPFRLADLYPTPQQVVSGAPKDNVPDDAEQRIARFQFLNQVLTTRSDVYTAYIEIRGYPSDDWRKGPVERTRMIVVFDRGRITDANGKVRIVAMYRY
ncbi:MAG: hypothetical protein IT443_09360 [Phycisphaeraceae bacterium]|nr:hypothetical protein [Phycisphaeraceae bacterium]